MDLVDKVVGGCRGAGRGEGGGEGRQTTRELPREEAREDTSCSTLSGSVSGRQQLSGSSNCEGGEGDSKTEGTPIAATFQKGAILKKKGAFLSK